MKYPKVLVCTVESWNSRNGANTFSTLFSEYDSNCLANLYIREEIPDSTVCGHYFQISENRVLKSLFQKKIKTGMQVEPHVNLTEEESENIAEGKSIYKKNKRSYVNLFAREMIWLLGRWKSEELINFLNSFNPEVVIFSMEGYIHFNRICSFILKHTKAKGIGYFWDDNFTYKQARGKLGYYILRFFQRKSLKRLANKTESFFAITEKTKREADDFFGISCKLLTKPIDLDKRPTYRRPSNVIHMLYTGNLQIGRINMIILVGKALQQINVSSVRIVLDVYSSTEISNSQKDEAGAFVNFKGFIKQEEVIKKHEEADVLLFVESFTGKNSKIARLSFSTKITDYLKAAKCILAIGPKDIAPMEYFEEKGSAICVFNEDDICTALNKIVEHPDLIDEYSKKAYECGKRYHERSKIQKVLYGEIGVNENSSN